MKLALLDKTTASNPLHLLMLQALLNLLSSMTGLIGDEIVGELLSRLSTLREILKRFQVWFLLLDNHRLMDHIPPCFVLVEYLIFAIFVIIEKKN